MQRRNYGAMTSTSYAIQLWEMVEDLRALADERVKCQIVFFFINVMVCSWVICLYHGIKWVWMDQWIYEKDSLDYVNGWFANWKTYGGAKRFASYFKKYFIENHYGSWRIDRIYRGTTLFI